ncbi:hypothetical protein SAMN05444392_11080 [Seinonella peptonophila]|uniref:Uncharacterized protein n=1 Tax=Seinonella peptonophila TaxID=112248 RepID=A0A1M4ZRW5_9BACL|nr:hypothetical protein [Seinonella peptonophila]SHF20748.1 hypothetical protein SAMN05444392_11080 [Seinonella peptonophila]
MRTIDAFLKAYKPAFLAIPGTRSVGDKLPLLIETYSHIYEADHNEYIFFQSNELKQDFASKTCKMQYISLDFEKELGKVLGFPDKAVEFFITKKQIKRTLGEHSAEYLKLKEKHIGLRYCGVQCAASIDDLIENVEWLWERYPYQEAIEDGTYVRVREERLRIPHGNTDQLEMIKELALTGEISKIHTLVS